ncbi:MAG: sigma 54-interacting transcriptional regulator [bacterium]
MEDVRRIRTRGELRESGWESRTIKEELAANVISSVASGDPLFPGIVGYDQSAIPELVNAILAGHDILILGERGQAKSRIIRSLLSLLDEWLPVVEGCEINDDPFRPVCRGCRELADKMGDELPISWISREERYGEKLATPDVSMADLIGDIDPVKVSEGRYLSDEGVIHYGLLPRANRGIFAVNELPDLSEKTQVGLFNILEERDVQIKGFKVRLPLDILIVATANPEDYTHRGRIITPLKDRYSSHVRTHYPRTGEDEIRIVEQESRLLCMAPEGLLVPEFIKDITIGITMEARRSPYINQSSGVSVRMSISNLESVVANARRRSLIQDEKLVVPRVSDLFAVVPSARGKLELEYTGEERSEEEVILKLLSRSIKSAFDSHFDVDEFESVISEFDGGAVMEVGSSLPASEYMDFYKYLPEVRESVKRLGVGDTPAELASAAELVLEGLHLHRRLNKQQIPGGSRYGKADYPPAPDSEGLTELV